MTTNDIREGCRLAPLIVFMMCDVMNMMNKKDPSPNKFMMNKKDPSPNIPQIFGFSLWCFHVIIIYEIL
jgi:hypothetical protein